VLLGGVVTVVAAVVLLRAVPAASSRIGAWHERATSRIALAARARAEVAALAELEERALAVRARFDSLGPKLLPATSRAEALGTLAARIEQVAAQHRSRVHESRGVPDSAAAGRLERVTLRVVLESDLEGLTGAIRALEGADPVVVVRSLRLHSAGAGAGGSEPVEVLQAELLASAWMLPLREGAR
jgi:hypothetical protein